MAYNAPSANRVLLVANLPFSLPPRKRRTTYSPNRSVVQIFAVVTKNSARPFPPSGKPSVRRKSETALLTIVPAQRVAESAVAAEATRTAKRLTEEPAHEARMLFWEGVSMRSVFLRSPSSYMRLEITAIEYINDLLAERSGLLSRLQRARLALPRGHPALIPRCMRESGGVQVPLWEREWKGGEGRTGSGDEDDDEEDDHS
jgi:hypothetical protein